MQRNSTTRQLVESALLTAITVILELIGYYIPVFFFVGLLVAPIPLILIQVRNGIKYSLLSLVIVFIAIAVTINPIGAVSSAILLGFISLSLGYCVKNKKSSTTSIFATSLGVFFTLAINLKLSNLIFGQDVIALFIDQMSKSVEIVANMYKNMGLPQDQIDILLKTIPSVESLKLLLPYGIITGSAVIGFVIYSVSAIILRKFGYNLEKIKPFSKWYLPMELMVVMLIIILVTFGINSIDETNGQMYVVNIMQIFNLIVTINGLALIAFFLKKKGVNKLLSFIIFYFLISSPLGRVLYFLGLIDYVLDYRKLDPKRKRMKLQ